MIADAIHDEAGPLTPAMLSAIVSAVGPGPDARAVLFVSAALRHREELKGFAFDARSGYFVFTGAVPLPPPRVVLPPGPFPPPPQPRPRRTRRPPGPADYYARPAGRRRRPDPAALLAARKSRDRMKP